MTALVPEAPDLDEDRRAIRALVDGWARFADRRLVDQQIALLAEDGRLIVYRGNPERTDPVRVVTGRTELAAALEILSTYEVTTHLNGQHTVDIDGDRATGESYCLAYHFSGVGQERSVMLMSIRYPDTFVRTGGRWFISERKLVTDWIERRPSPTE